MFISACVMTSQTQKEELHEKIMTRKTKRSETSDRARDRAVERRATWTCHLQEEETNISHTVKHNDAQTLLELILKLLLMTEDYN